jgi:hypothetical protein
LHLQDLQFLGLAGQEMARLVRTLSAMSAHAGVCCIGNHTHTYQSGMGGLSSSEAALLTG